MTINIHCHCGPDHCEVQPCPPCGPSPALADPTPVTFCSAAEYAGRADQASAPGGGKLADILAVAEVVIGLLKKLFAK